MSASEAYGRGFSWGLMGAAGQKLTVSNILSHRRPTSTLGQHQFRSLPRCSCTAEQVFASSGHVQHGHGLQFLDRWFRSPAA